MIDSQEKLTRDSRTPKDAGSSQEALRLAMSGYGWALASTVLVTAAAMPLSGWLAPTNLVMVFLVGVVVVALRWGRGPAALAAVTNVAAFDWFYVPPLYTFAVDDWQYLVTFGVMLAVGLLIGQLTAGLRFQAAIMATRERRAQGLFELARDLSGALQASEVARLGERALRRELGGDAVVVLSDAHGRLLPPQAPPAGYDAMSAHWVFANGVPAGMGAYTPDGRSWHYLPLKAPVRVRGVLALQPSQARWFMVPDQRQQIETLGRQVAIALERVHYVEVAQQTLVEMESERLRNSVLAALSHDVRTPLTALIGLAEQLRNTEPALTVAQNQLASAVIDQGHELATLVGNLLEMARLQSGQVRLRLEWQSVEELVGGALRSVRHVLPRNQIVLHLPSELPLVQAEATLIQRVLVNLLENATKYGRPPVEIRALAEPGALLLTVRDHGPGLAALWHGREEALFHKFTRGQAESSVRGVGLGLAICKAVVDAHKGTIDASNASGGGAEFSIRLPLREPPEMPGEDKAA